MTRAAWRLLAASVVAAGVAASVVLFAGTWRVGPTGDRHELYVGPWNADRLAPLVEHPVTLPWVHKLGCSPACLLILAAQAVVGYRILATSWRRAGRGSAAEGPTPSQRPAVLNPAPPTAGDAPCAGQVGDAAGR